MRRNWSMCAIYGWNRILFEHHLAANHWYFISKGNMKIFINTIWITIPLALSTFTKLKYFNGLIIYWQSLTQLASKKVGLAHWESTQMVVTRHTILNVFGFIYLLFSDPTFRNANQTYFARGEYVTWMVPKPRFALVGVCQVHWKQNICHWIMDMVLLFCLLLCLYHPSLLLFYLIHLPTFGRVSSVALGDRGYRRIVVVQEMLWRNEDKIHLYQPH